MTLTLAALAVAAFLVGGVPFGYLLAKKLAGIDVRRMGSGNIGATNVARVAGKKIGIAALVLDALKGLVPTLAARLLMPELAWAHVVVGAAAILGHVFPVWLKLRGGKGVATALGVYLVLLPWAALCGLVVFAACYGIWRVVSIGSMAGAVTASAVAFASQAPISYSALSAAAAVLILFRHRGNITRLIRRQEHRL